MIHWANLLWIIPIVIIGTVMITALAIAAGQHRDDE